ncbi:tyrosine-type recombinase/integrase [Pontixanthobacter gangjinensis]|uniref:Tyrosine-type recombinase/integrase n=1 Tax=Pontixanthobacter gangjinensis TaxID=1028742 RepID=A0A6I4SIS8_9SPHN|nr:site-specific integrase [Pontixanthobacter gangjinensis]MXO55288.1 tyrosine-type recombinase/integrase [Pontixanthobacter gangjinensis]
MKQQKLTEKIVREMIPPSIQDQLIVRDIVMMGLAIRITRSGHRAFVFNYYCNGTQRRMTIGSPPAWSVSAARERAKQIRRQIDAGVDPLEEKRKARDEETLAGVWKRYRDDVLSTRSSKTQVNVTSIWDRLVLPALGRQRLAYIHQPDIEKLHRKVSQRTPTQSNRMLASIQHVFSKSIQWGLSEQNPVKGVERNREAGRVRFLSDTELERFLSVLRQSPKTPSSLAIEFLLLTGARSGETFRAKWSEFDLDAAVWQKPAANTKSRKLHRVPLSPEAIQLLLSSQRIAVNEYVFPGKSGAHLTTVKTLFTRLIKEARIEGFRIHDLRHSYASMLAIQGVPLLAIGNLLGHSQLSTTARYAHLDDSNLREATRMVGNKVKMHGK